jgi:hypothetical protein
MSLPRRGDKRSDRRRARGSEPFRRWSSLVAHRLRFVATGPGPHASPSSAKCGLVKDLRLAHPDLLQPPRPRQLLIAAAFLRRTSDQHARTPWLSSFHRTLPPEMELVELAAEQDWLLALYDGWDTRMEAATLFLAARADVRRRTTRVGAVRRPHFRQRSAGTARATPRSGFPAPSRRVLRRRIASSFRRIASRQPWRLRCRAAVLDCLGIPLQPS